MYCDVCKFSVYIVLAELIARLCQRHEVSETHEEIGDYKNCTLIKCIHSVHKL